MIIDGVGVYFTNDSDYIYSGIYVPFRKPLGNGLVQETVQDQDTSVLSGPILTDNSTFKYQAVLAVRRTYLIRENPIFYFYTDAVMDWKNNPGGWENTFD
ncbi:unnamed protein product, partial [Heligmosomoides polygyrus]